MKFRLLHEMIGKYNFLVCNRKDREICNLKFITYSLNIQDIKFIFALHCLDTSFFLLSR